MLNLTDEALYTAERGRAQALRDALKINYRLKLLSPRSNESEEAIDFILRKISVLPVFMALGNKAINMWVLSKAKDTIFKVVELKSEGAHEDCFASLLETTLRNIRAGVDVRCENRSLDAQIVNSTASTRNNEEEDQCHCNRLSTVFSHCVM